MNARNDIITMIYSKNFLEYKTENVSGTYVAETLDNYLDEWFPVLHPPQTGLSAPNWPVFITAPTGSGKSTFVLNDLAKFIAGRGRVLLLTNRVALRLQQRINSNFLQGLPRLGSYMLENTPISGNVDIITYHEALRYLYNDYYGMLNSVKAVVFDEAHFFTSDSTYVHQTSFILRSLINRFFTAKRIYMTATPDDVKPIIAYEEKLAYDMYLWSNFGPVDKVPNEKRSSAKCTKKWAKKIIFPLG